MSSSCGIQKLCPAPFSPVSIGDLGSLKLDQWMGCVKPNGGTSVVATIPDPCHYLAQGCYVTMCDLAQGWAGPGSQGHTGAAGVGMLQGKDSLMYSKIQKTDTIGVRAKLLQSCPNLCNPMGCSPPGFSVHGILQARILEWVVMPSSRGSS